MSRFILDRTLITSNTITFWAQEGACLFKRVKELGFSGRIEETFVERWRQMEMVEKRSATCSFPLADSSSRCASRSSLISHEHDSYRWQSLHISLACCPPTLTVHTPLWHALSRLMDWRFITPIFAGCHTLTNFDRWILNHNCPWLVFVWRDCQENYLSL